MNEPVDVEVIIIGAGIAGLTAAFTILEKEPSINILILESSGRIGGRTHSVPLLVGKDGAKHSFFELGGETVCKEQIPLMKLLKQLNIPLVKCNDKRGTTVLCYQSSVLYVESSNNGEDCLKFLRLEDKWELSRFIVKIEKLCKKLRQSPDPNTIWLLCQMPLDKFLEENLKSSKARSVIEHMVITSCGTRTSEISVLFYVFFCMTSSGIHYNLPILGGKLRQYFNIHGGTRHLCDALIERVGSRYIIRNEHVRSILCGNTHVKIVTDCTSYSCYSVIVTIPPLDVMKVYFNPPLANERVDCLSGIAHNVDVTTFVVTYSKPFWKDLGFSGNIYSFDKNDNVGPIHSCSDVSDRYRAALSGRIIGFMNIKREAGSFKNAILGELSSLFGDEALAPLDFYEKTWSNNKNCSQMFCWATDMLGFIHVVTKRHERVFWAGSETSKEWYGTIAGAVNSGTRAALEVLYDLRPASLTTDDMFILSPGTKTRAHVFQQTELLPSNYRVRYWKYYTVFVIIMLYLLWKLKKRYLSNQ